MNLKNNILGKLKMCIFGVLLFTFILGTFAFLFYFKTIFQDKVTSGVHKVTENVSYQLKERGKQFEARKHDISVEYTNRLGYDSGVLQQTVPATLWNLEPEAAGEIIKAFLNKEEISAIRVDDESGKLFAAMQKKNGVIIPVKDEKEFVPDGAVMISELAKSGKKLGQVKLYYTDGPLKQQLTQVDGDISTSSMQNSNMVESINNSLSEAISAESRNIVWIRATEMGVVFVAVFVIISGFISLFMVKPLKSMLLQLNKNSHQIKSAAAQVAKGAEVLASVTSTEAASVEETSATVQELSSMTQRNADHAKQTDQLMGETRSTVTTASTSMNSLFDSIQEIKQSSAATSKIIKTIDEISFQTNILALNAAVEAARVGVHGAGFAVVADEVRSLAQRAAEAAKDTANLIENTNRQIGQAASLVEETRQRFDAVNSQVSKSSGFVSQIADASADQARGLEQLNTTIGEIGKVVQQNAASSQESAAASQEMSAQTDSMDQVINNLSLMVGGGIELSAPTKASIPASERQSVFTAPVDRNNGNGNGAQRSKRSGPLVNVNDSDFKSDF